MLKKFINWIQGKDEVNSGDVAANRMKLMVVHDRFQMPPALVEEMKTELLNVASKYFEIDPETAECMIKSQGSRRAFISATVPLINRGPKLNNDDGNTNKNKKSSRKNKKDLSASAA